MCPCRELSGILIRFLAKLHRQHGATHEKQHLSCYTWEVGHGMGRPMMLEDTNDRRWTYTLTHKYPFHTHTHTHVHMHVHMSRVFDSLNCVFLCFEIMLIADPATQSLALTSRQHVSLSVLLNLWLCHFLLFVQKSSTTLHTQLPSGDRSHSHCDCQLLHRALFAQRAAFWLHQGKSNNIHVVQICVKELRIALGQWQQCLFGE